MVITVSFLFYLTYERMCFKIESLRKEGGRIMADKFYAKGPGNNGYIKNLEVLDFNPWKVALSRCRFTKLQKENTICMVPVLAVHRMVY